MPVKSLPSLFVHLDDSAKFYFFTTKTPSSVDLERVAWFFNWDRHITMCLRFYTTIN